MLITKILINPSEHSKDQPLNILNTKMPFSRGKVMLNTHFKVEVYEIFYL